MTAVTLRQANAICEAVLEKARELKLRPITVAVVDPGGHLVGFQREDNSAILRYEIAMGKAYACVGMGRSTRGLQEMAQQRPYFANSLGPSADGKFTPVLGGVLLRDRTGAVAGAVGVTGDTADNDEICAIAGVEAAGLVPDLS